jgi:ELWxxDGT repeat protein
MTITRNVAFFTGASPTNNAGYWVTDGTVAGTSEITTSAFDPLATLVVFHTAYTNAIDTSGNVAGGLWVSDGTAAGTIEVGGLKNQGIAGAGSGFGASSFISYRGEVLFRAQDTTLHSGLWITDGTAAGTTEIGGLNDRGVNGASAAGFVPVDFVAFDGKIYFHGADSSNNGGLWVTDGTASGTTEIGGLHNGGVAGAPASGLSLFSSAVANGQLFFSSIDANSKVGLWVSDGTAAGTSEIGGVADLAVNDVGTGARGLNPDNLVQFNGDVFFTGSDSAGGLGLWTSDGTASGTFELGGLKDQGITGASANGLAPTDIVRLGNRLVFNGADTAGGEGLWVTDGTVAGTFEVGGRNDQNVVGANANGLQPVGLAVLNGMVLFSGLDSQAHTGLWETDGTAAGTIELGGLRDQAIFGVNANGLQPSSIATPSTVTATSDFNGDFYSDVLWRNSSGGLSDWSMNAGSIVSGGALTQGGVAVNPDASWSVAGIADFDGNGEADMLWRNTNGVLADWSMNGRTIVWSNALTASGAVVTPDASWSIVGLGDFNGDSSADILWRNTSDELSEWQMNGSTVINGGDVTSAGIAVRPDASWSVVGIGDFNGDGRKDILWRNTSGEVTEWQMNGSTITSSGDLTSGDVSVRPDASWSVAGIGDFNGDGNSDILWRNSNGSLSEWLMNGSTIVSSGSVASGGIAVEPDTSWHIVEIGDFNGDGRSDILWRNDNGAMSEWLMNGTTIAQAITPSSSGGAVSPNATWSTQAKPTNFG